ncbi:MAG: M1 family metallopeptidase, partial [Candidatus Neomarinimicrobiota bacterium]
MKSVRTFLFSFAFISGFVWATESYWQQDVHYTMQVRLDTENHQLTGTSHIVYTNHSPDSLRHFFLMLYPNAFKPGSVRYREAQQIYRRPAYPRATPRAYISEDNPSGIDISSLTLTLPSGAATSSFKVDDTILEVALPEPLAPGARLTLDLEWVHTVRRHTGRAGYRGEQYDMAQWYPKVVVYDEHGWNNEPFHLMGEFYGEFSTFDVTIDVPYSYVLGATGVVTSGDPGWEAARVDTSVPFNKWSETYREERESRLAGKEDERRTITFHAEKVHDFAWIASADFVYESGSWNGTQVNVLYNLRVGQDWTKKVVQRSERTLEWLSTRFGPYPYPQVTTTHALMGGGMEYPMLVMNGSESESLIVHEIGHIWFYGMLGNNEMEEAWLDEGFTTFQTSWYMTSRYGHLGVDQTALPDTWFQRHRKRTPSLAQVQWLGASLQTSGYNEPIATAAYRSGSSFAYGRNAYTKASLMLEQLQYILGEETFDRAMQSYYRQWALKHVNEYRFRRAMEQASGQELDWFFDQWLHTAGYLDYALKGWKQHPTDEGYEVTVNLLRKGPWEAPVVVEAITATGQRVRTTWDDFRHQTTGTVTLQAPEKVRRIVLDPDDKLMDIDPRNNRSGMLPTSVGFMPLVAYYLPRDRYTLAYWPAVWYNYTDQLTPMVRLNRWYGPGFDTPYSDTEMGLGYGPGSGALDWHLEHRWPLFLYDTRLTGTLEAFDRDGVRGA